MRAAWPWRRASASADASWRSASARASRCPTTPPASRVVGIDISEPMLKVARRRVVDEGLEHVELLEVMDAENLEFPDASFDVVVAQYVVNTVPQSRDRARRVPARAEAGRRAGDRQPGRRRRPARATRFEHLFQPIAQRLGWRSKFPWERFERWAARSPAAYLIERRPVPPLGHFSLIRFGKLGAGEPRRATSQQSAPRKRAVGPRTCGGYGPIARQRT